MPAIDTAKGRFYPWADQKFVSVTTVIGEGIPKPQLNKWFVKEMARIAALHRLHLSTLLEEEALQFLIDYREPGFDGASTLGSNVHSIAEKIARGKKHRTPTAKEAPYVEGFVAFIEKYSPRFIETEATVYSREHGYAGTMDAQVEIDGKVYVMDIKTGKGVWPEAALQIAAYRHADFIGRSDGREDGLTPSDGGLVLHLRPRSFNVIPVDTGLNVFDTFLSALDIYRWVNMDSRFVIGERW